jgi:hypothetical protein
MTATGYLAKLILRARGAERAVRPRLPARFEAPATAGPGAGWVNARPARDAAPRAASATGKAGFIPTGELPGSRFPTRGATRATDVGEATRLHGIRHAPELPSAARRLARTAPSRLESGPTPNPPSAEAAGSPARARLGGTPGRSAQRAQESAEADGPVQRATPETGVRPAARPVPLSPQRIAIAGKPAAGIARAVSTPTGPAAASPAIAGPAPERSAVHGETPTVRVSIGRVDVRADLTPVPSAKRPSVVQQKRDSSLSDYLKGRGRP